MITEYASTQPDVVMPIVDISPRWRAIHDMAVWKRIIGGGIQLLRDYYRVLRQLQLRPDVIHLTTPGQFALIRDIAIMKAARRYRVPVIYHIRFGRVPELAKGVSREWKLISKAMRLASSVMTIDVNTTAAINLHLPDIPVNLVPNCVDLRCLPMAGNAEQRTVMFLGWVISTKGVEELVQAWAMLQPADWRLIIVGPGKADYQQQLLDKYQTENMEFLGEKDHDSAMQLMADAEIFVLPSYTEGFPNVVVEAMALGKPIIATRVGAIPEMLADECGILIEPNDEVALQAALLKLMSDEELRCHLGKRAKERAESLYSLEAVFQQYMAIWRNASNGK